MCSVQCVGQIYRNQPREVLLWGLLSHADVFLAHLQRTNVERWCNYMTMIFNYTGCTFSYSEPMWQPVTSHIAGARNMSNSQRGNPGVPPECSSLISISTGMLAPLWNNRCWGFVITLHLQIYIWSVAVPSGAISCDSSDRSLSSHK